MRVSYVIVPSDSKEYVFRCMNSLYRQTCMDFEIILAENVFDDLENDIRDYLHAHEDIKCISEFATSFEEKMKEAISLIADDVEYITFISMDTVVAPETTELVEREAREAAIFVPSVVLKEGKKTFVSRIIEDTLFDDVCALGLYRVFFGKETIVELAEAFFENKDNYEIYKLKQLLDSKIVGSVKIGFYFDKRVCSVGENNGTLCSETLPELFQQAMESDKQELKIRVFCYYLEKYIVLLSSKEIDADKKMEAFNSFKEIGRFVEQDFVLGKLYELYLGCSAKEVQYLDFVSYQLYISKVNVLSGTREIAATVTASEKDLFARQIPEINSLVVTQEQMSADMQELKANLHYLMQMVSNGVEKEPSGSGNLLEDVPRLFSQGKLGFSIILKSIKAWLSYKLRRGKK